MSSPANKQKQPAEALSWPQVFWRSLGPSWRWILLSIVLSGLLVGYVQPLGEQRTAWWGWFEPISGGLTLLLALAIWLADLAQRWKGSLPRKLTVTFVDQQGRCVMRCERAYLSGEADIRAWGQQLGSQMAENDRQLALDPAIRATQGRAEQDVRGVFPKEESYFMHFQVVFTLRRIPECFKKERYAHWEATGEPLVLWQPPNFQDVRGASKEAPAPAVEVIREAGSAPRSASSDGASVGKTVSTTVATPRQSSGSVTTIVTARAEGPLVTVKATAAQPVESALQAKSGAVLPAAAAPAAGAGPGAPGPVNGGSSQEEVKP